ncbi:MAG: hypothetical protein C0467_27660 [Planctomycetaceae bacterium]|nr:hypothetical protein [Planctomycetaceae bacterium]
MNGNPCPPGGNPKCFAQHLGECEGEIEKEHPVSECVLLAVSGGKSTIFVRGRPSQKEGEVREIPIPNIVSHVLCAKHNRALTDFDAAGGKFAEGMEAMNALLGDTKASFDTFEVDGDALERWMLKVLYGAVFGGDTKLPDNAKSKGILPPIEGLRILYKGESFPPGQGLYLLPGPPGANATDELELGREPLMSADGNIAGMRFVFYGFNFVLLVANVHPDHASKLDDWMYRPKGITIRGCNKLLRFKWKTGAYSDTHLVTWEGLFDLEGNRIPREEKRG